MTHSEAVKIARKLSGIYLEPAIVFRAYGIEDTDCFVKILHHDSPYTCVLDSEFQEHFGDMSNAQVEARIKAIVE